MKSRVRRRFHFSASFSFRRDRPRGLVHLFRSSSPCPLPAGPYSTRCRQIWSGRLVISARNCAAESRTKDGATEPGQDAEHGAERAGRRTERTEGTARKLAWPQRAAALSWSFPAPLSGRASPSCVLRFMLLLRLSLFATRPVCPRRPPLLDLAFQTGADPAHLSMENLGEDRRGPPR